MPRVNLPTPASSCDTRGTENIQTSVYSLPSVANQDRVSTSPATPSTNDSDSSYHPVSPGSAPTVNRKRPAVQSGSMITKDDFSLPPPPTRSRKIIQMKPRETDHQTSAHSIATSTPSVNKSTNGKKKQGNTGTTAAGRKIARKTAHSLIERRRRSKMNEEFGVLKDMIPACKGQEMHKLAILQASIEYLRYLEQCVSDLQAQNNSAWSIPPPPSSSTGRSDRVEADEVDDDEEMEDDPEPALASVDSSRSNLRSSGSLVSLPPLSQITSVATTTTTSPSVFSTNGSRNYSISSLSSQPSYSPLYPSNHTSPAFGPQLHQFSSAGPGFGLGSPALKAQDPTAWYRQVAESATERLEKHARLASTSTSTPSAITGVVSAHPIAPAQGRTEHELDREATTALLMLNHDRRNWRAQEPEVTRSSTGMSVKDLLSG